MEWINVADNIPERDQSVYCYGQYGDDDCDDEKYGFKGYLDAKGRWYAFNNGDGGYGHDYRAKVTHWMPLPEPPSE